jgi:hypothetical protein
MYIFVAALVIAFYTFSDLNGLNRSKAEREAMKLIANSDVEIVELPNKSIVIGYEIVTDYKKTVEKANLMYYWKITDRRKLFYNKPE